MRLLMYRRDGRARAGALRGDRVVDLTHLAALDPAAPRIEKLAYLIDAGEEGLAKIRPLLDIPELETRIDRAGHGDQAESLRLADAQILPPLNPCRGNVIAIGRNYHEHAVESARARNEEVDRPTVFTKAQTSIAGPYDDIVVDPAVTSEVDWETELAVVIGRSGKNIPRDEAMDYVFGYMVLNDVSARDVQYGWGGQFFKGKSLDGFCPIGPWIVTADEVPDPQNLRLTTRVNGVVKQDANTRDMIFAVAELIAQLSIGMTLLPGTLIATGTPAGVGFARTPKEFLHPGDVLESEIEGIGMMRNRITSGGTGATKASGP